MLMNEMDELVYPFYSHSATMPFTVMVERLVKATMDDMITWP
jgi:hypothetical protein